MSRNSMSPRGWLAFVTLGVVWGAPFLLIKIALRGIPAVHVAWCELTLGAAALLLVATWSGELRSVRGRWLAVGSLALLQLAVPSLLIAVSERWIRSSLAGTLNATTPLLVVPLAPLFRLHRPLQLRRTAGLVVGFAGVIVLLGFDMPKGSHEWAGVACMLSAALSYAAAPLLIERYLQGVQGLGPSAASLAIASAALLPAAILHVPARAPSLAAIGCLAALGVICTAGGMLLYFFLVQEAGASRASVVKYLNPGVAAILGALVLGESFPPTSIVGLIMILSGSWLAAHDYNNRRARESGNRQSLCPADEQD